MYYFSHFVLILLLFRLYFNTKPNGFSIQKIYHIAFLEIFKKSIYKNRVLW